MDLMGCSLQLEELKQILNYQYEEKKAMFGQNGKD